MARIRSLVILAATGVALLAAPASAEFALDGYLGGAFADSSRVHLGTGAGQSTLSVDWDSSFAVGLRGAYWLEGAWGWLGFGLDWSYMDPELSVDPELGAPLPNPLRIQIFPVTPLLMVRIPLFKSEKFEHGRLAPYAAVGPGIYISKLDSRDVRSDGSEFPVGIDYRFGMSLMLTKRIGVFSEYRYSSATFKFKGDVTQFKTDLEISQALVGVTLRF